MRKYFFFFLLLSLSAPSWAADMRCQGDLMTPGTIMTKVRAKCGDPKNENRVGEIRVHSTDKQSERLMYITEMTYEADGGYYVLTFEGSELTKTDFIPK